MRFGGGVLCGGESRRMGRPKAWLAFGNEVMLQRVVGAAEGRMPPIGSNTLDPKWINLLVQWIKQVEKPEAKP